MIFQAICTFSLIVSVVANTSPPSKDYLTWWMKADNPVYKGPSCEYTNGPVGTDSEWLDTYVRKGMFCAVDEKLYDGGLGCGKCYRLNWDNSMYKSNDVVPADMTSSTALIQVTDSGAGGVDHFDCYDTAFHQLTGISTGVFGISWTEVDCEESPVSVAMFDGNNAYYTKVLLAGGRTSVKSASITVGDKTFFLQKGGGATWYANLSGDKNKPVSYDITFSGGTSSDHDVHLDCYNGQWPVPTNTICSVSLSPTTSTPTSAPSVAPPTAPTTSAPTVDTPINHSGSLLNNWQFEQSNTSPKWENMGSNTVTFEYDAGLQSTVAKVQNRQETWQGIGQETFGNIAFEYEKDYYFSVKAKLLDSGSRSYESLKLTLRYIYTGSHSPDYHTILATPENEQDGISINEWRTFDATFAPPTPTHTVSSIFIYAEMLSSATRSFAIDDFVVVTVGGTAPAPTESPTSAPTQSPTKQPTESPTSAPTSSPTKQPSESPTSAPTNSPTKQPTESPTSAPTNSPTNQPTESPTSAPTNSPTEQPTESPTSAPTNSPTKQPSESPTSAPTNSPTEQPTESPTSAPTNSPTNQPTESPTSAPTNSPTEPPTYAPTNSPTEPPTNSPSSSPTNSPTNLPTAAPTLSPTKQPTKSQTAPRLSQPITKSPTSAPTYSPTSDPTTSPTSDPTNAPTKQPTSIPTNSPTNQPTTSPTAAPTNAPTNQPSNSPTNQPSNSPTNQPTNSPTNQPTNSPTKEPPQSPTSAPTSSPTEQPTSTPTHSPTEQPTTSPTAAPTNSPTKKPTLHPTHSPTPAPVPATQPGTPSPDACCSNNYKTCINYCGTTEAECNQCSNKQGWLFNGPPQYSCLVRWADCHGNNNCCPGLRCEYRDDYYSQCVADK